MNWTSIGEFVDMGGYGLYVWGSFTMTGIAMAWEAFLLAQRRWRALEALREEIRRDAPA